MKAEKIISKLPQSENQLQTRIGLQGLQVEIINLDLEIDLAKRRKDDIQFEINSVDKEITWRDQELEKLRESVNYFKQNKSILSKKNKESNESPPETSTSKSFFGGWFRGKEREEVKGKSEEVKGKGEEVKGKSHHKKVQKTNQDTPTQEVKQNADYVHYLFVVDKSLEDRNDIQECIKRFDESVKPHQVNIHSIDTKKLKKLPGVITDGPLPTLVVILILKNEIASFDSFVSNSKKGYTSPNYWLVLGWEGLLSFSVLKKYATTANGNFMLQIGNNSIDACETPYDVPSLEEYLSRVSASFTVATPSHVDATSNLLAREIERSKQEFERAVQASTQSQNQVLAKNEQETQSTMKRLTEAQKEKDDKNLEEHQQRKSNLESEREKLKQQLEELKKEDERIAYTLQAKIKEKEEKEMLTKEALKEIPTPKKCESDPDLYSLVYIYGSTLNHVFGLINNYQKHTADISVVVECAQSLLDEFASHQEDYYKLLKEIDW